MLTSYYSDIKNKYYQAYFRGYITDCKDNIFDDGADVVMGRLTKAAESIGETLDEAMGKLAQKVYLFLRFISIIRNLTLLFRLKLVWPFFGRALATILLS
jgi:hypothetical protein